MQVIRLYRGGRKKYPVYRIVSADKRRPVNGKFLTILGTYNPHTKQLVIKKEELQTAIANGAQPSNAVLKLMQKDGLKLPQWAKIETRTRPPKKAVEQPAEQPTTEASAGENAVKEPASDATESSAEVETKADTDRPTLKVEKGEEEMPAELEKSAIGEQRGKEVAAAVIEEAQAENATKEEKKAATEADSGINEQTTVSSDQAAENSQ